MRRRLDDDNAKGHSRDDPVAAWKMARLRLAAERQLGSDRTLPRDGFVEPAVLRRVDDIHAPGLHRHGTGRDRPQMGLGIDAASQSGNHRETGAAEGAGEISGDAPAACRGVARADDGDDRAGQQPDLPENRQDRRRILDRREGAWISRLTPADQAAADSRQPGQFGFGSRARRRRDGPAVLVAPRQPRECVERRPRRAKAPQQRIEADRTDGFGAAQPQPVQPFLRIELARGQDLNLS